MIVTIRNGVAPTKEEIIVLRYGSTDTNICMTCGRRIRSDAGDQPSGRPRRFCSNACRQRFWTAHPDKNGWESFEEATCECCKQTFRAAHKNNRARRYCSRACANRGRAMERK